MTGKLKVKAFWDMVRETHPDIGHQPPVLRRGVDYPKKHFMEDSSISTPDIIKADELGKFFTVEDLLNFQTLRFNKMFKEWVK